MTDLRKAAEQALNALEAIMTEFKALDLPYGSKAYALAKDARLDLRAALEEPTGKVNVIKTWNERCETHPDHQTGMVSNLMIQARMQEEIDELRAALADREHRAIERAHGIGT